MEKQLKLKKIKIQNFCGIKKYEGGLSDYEIIEGKSGNGKSTIIKALRWVFGLTISGYVPTKIVDGKVITEIELPLVILHFSWGNAEHYIGRVGKQLVINDITFETQKAYRKALSDMFEMDYELLVNRLFIGDYLTRARKEVRNDLLESCGVNEALENLKDEIFEGKKFKDNDIKNQIKILEKELEQKIEITKRENEIINELVNRALRVKENLMQYAFAETEKEAIECEFEKEFFTDLVIGARESILKSQFLEQIEIANLYAKYEAFTKASVNIIQEKVSSIYNQDFFWQLFDYRKNGELVETCELVYKGTPYLYLSRGEQLKVAIELKRFFDKRYGDIMPLIVDNITDLDKEIKPNKNEQVIILKTNEGKEIKGLEKW